MSCFCPLLQSKDSCLKLCKSETKPFQLIQLGTREPDRNFCCFGDTVTKAPVTQQSTVSVSVLASKCQELCQRSSQENWFDNKLIDPRDLHTSPSFQDAILLGFSTHFGLCILGEPSPNLLDFAGLFPTLHSPPNSGLYFSYIRMHVSLLKILLFVVLCPFSSHPHSPSPVTSDAFKSKWESPGLRKILSLLHSTVCLILNSEKGHSWSFGFIIGRR